jgi:hypothetical protein
VNIVSLTLINPIGKKYDRGHRNVYDDYRSGGTFKKTLGSVPNGRNGVVRFKTAP